MLTEVRRALRSLASSPGISLAAVVTLALGVGAATVAATVLRGVLLAPLAYPESDRLVRIYQTLPSLRGASNPRLAAIWNRLPVSFLNAADVRESRTVEAVGLCEETTVVLASDSEARDVTASRIQPELLETLGTPPLLGRPFTRAEARQGLPVALLSHGLWLSDFGGQDDVVGQDDVAGQTLRLDGEATTVVGVMPPGFALPGRQDQLWTPLTPAGEDLSSRENFRYTAIARLRPEASLDEARQDLASLAAAWADERTMEGETERAEDAGLRLVPLLETVVGESRRAVLLLACAALGVLLTAGVNVTHLLLARGVDRRRELAVKRALGASRRRLLAGAGLESLLLALAGGALGLALAPAALGGLAALAADELPRIEGLAIDGGAAVDALVASLAVALAAGLLPAFLAGAVEPAETMARGGTGRASRHRSGAQSGLMITEVALALMLTATAALLAISWQRLTAVEPGFEPRGVLVQELRLPAWLYPDAPRRQDFSDRLSSKLTALPGVREVALTSRLPAAGPVEVWGFRIVGRDAEDGDWTQGRITAMHFATPDYFRLLGIPIVAGRPFAASPGAGTREVVVNQIAARRHWPGEGPVGAEVVMGEHTYRVVGVMADVRHLGQAEEPGELMVQPWSQRPSPDLAILVTFEDDSTVEQAGSLRAALRRLEPALPLAPAVTLEGVLAEELAGPRSRTLLVGLLTAVALLLTVVGTYAMMAYAVGRRRREIGIRMALGADAARVRRLVLSRTLRLATIGVALGLSGALATGRLLEGLLWGVEASDPPTLAATALLILATCLAAGDLPARRASRLEPARTLRSD